MTATDRRPLLTRLEASRRELLDLTLRNRLLHTPRRSSRIHQVEAVGERSEQVFRRLVREGKTMSFRPAPAEFVQAADAAPIDAAPWEAFLPEASAGDEALQTALSAEALHRRLLKLFYDARTYEEEQGVGILFLALGFLKWYETPQADQPRFAPLLLVPATLSRTSVRASFRVGYSGEELTTNLSLQAKLKLDYGLALPELPPAEDLSPGEYFAQVRQAVHPGQPRWEVCEDDIVLGFFSFSRFLMYRDLDPEQWPDERPLTGHPLLVPLLHSGFPPQPGLFAEDERLDPHLPPEHSLHVVEADSSQAAVIEEVRRGRNLVVQGPPGTGKSQTITNLIAAAVHDGKRVLFVAEKMAALEVVFRRLNQVGLGPLCLELHSHKANKRDVLAELGRTLELGRPKLEGAGELPRLLGEVRQPLNEHAERMHAPLGASGRTLYQVLGEMVHWRDRGLWPPRIRLPAAREWTPAEHDRRRAGVQDLIDHLQRIGAPGKHPWRGVRARGLSPLEGDRLAAGLPELVQRLQRLARAGEQLAQRLELPRPATIRDVVQLAELARRLLRAPDCDRTALQDAVWASQAVDIRKLVEDGRTCRQLRQELEAQVVPQAWEYELVQTRRDLAAWGTAWLRWLSGRYRRAVGTLRALLVGPLPPTLNERLAILDKLLKAQEMRASLAARDDLGRRAFGRFWQGEASDWSALAAICQWEAECRTAGVQADFRQLLARAADLASLQAPLEAVRQDFKPLKEALESLVQALDWDLPAQFAQRELWSIPLQPLVAHWQACSEAPEELMAWCAYRDCRQQLAGLGLGPLVEAVEAGTLKADELLGQFHLACCEELYRLAQAQWPQVQRFDGPAHQRQIDRFCVLDRQRQLLARQEVALRHWERLPRGEVGEMGLLRREIHKKRRHLPLRQLFKQAGRAIQQIKPVFLMSPLSVAQFLEPGAVEFDLLVIDEASQVRPVEALGAIARARQMVVVGDDRQLPPTHFFTRLLGDADEEPQAAGLHTGDLESILALCAAQGLPARMLRWHYRSRHESLIAVSNQQFYDHRLLVVPSPQAAGGPYGLRFHYLDKAVYDRGGTATNRLEAAAVAEAVLHFARQHPDLSLGVGTFSVAQRDAILDELEERRREHPECEAFFANDSAEPFFVKNLENIQGDERDVIFISVGYARDSRGVLTMNFGPLTAEGGHRRLNVLITRARQRCEVFSAITADDIDLTRTEAWGVRALKAFLQFARDGQHDLAPADDGSPQATLFEQQVAETIRSLGYEAVPQPSPSRCFLDLAVRDPRNPDQYLLGIQCDGQTYQAARWARDRDRLRQEILQARGWQIHRLWALDWLRHPGRERERLAEALQQARQRLAQREASPQEKEAESHAPFPGPQTIPLPGRIVRHEQERTPGSASPSVPYAVTTLKLRQVIPFPELDPAEQAHIVQQIIQTEGPIHREEIVQRAAILTGMQRVGPRVTQAVMRLLHQGRRKGQFLEHDGFFALPGQTAVLRNRDEVPWPSLRSARMVPPEELAAAILCVVRQSVGAAPEEIAREVAGLLGLKSGPSLREAIQVQLDRLCRQGSLQWQGERLVMPPPARRTTGDSA